MPKPPPWSLLRHFVREFLVFAFFVAASVVMTWPLARNFSTAVSDVGDPFVSISIFDWNFWATFHRPTDVFHQPIFHPARYALAFTEHLYGIAFLVFPLYALGVPSIAAYNVALVLGFAVAGYGAYVLGRMVTGSAAASIAGGIFFAFVPYRITQIPHISYLWSGWLALLLAALLAYDRRPTAKRALLFGVLFFINGVTCLHWLAMGGTAIALTALSLWILRGHDRDYGLRLGAAMAAAAVALTPFLRPYQKVGELYGMTRHSGELRNFSARWSDWFTGGVHLRYSALVSDGSVDPERWLFPGFMALVVSVTALVLLRREDLAGAFDDVTPTRNASAAPLLRILDLALALIGVWALVEVAARRPVPLALGAVALIQIGRNALAPTLFLALLVARLVIRFPAALGGATGRSLISEIRGSRFSPGVWVALLWISIGVLGSLGLNSFLHTFLFDYVRPFQSIRVPSRWAMIAYVGLSVLVSCGVVALMRRRGSLAQKWVPLLVSVLLLLELRPRPFRWYVSSPDSPPVYRWLRDLPISGAILELPIATFHSEYVYLRRAREHGRPLVNGVSSFVPGDFDRLAAMAQANPIDPQLLTRLEQIGCAFIVVHADHLAMYNRTTREWLQQGLRASRLAFVGRFPHHLRGDYLFAVNRVVPEAGFHRQPDLADPAGATSSDHLRRFLASNAFTYFDTPIALIDEPLFGAQVREELTVNGWAASPHGIERVNLLFSNTSVSVAADLFARGDLARHLPGYPPGSTTGFRVHFPKRPKWTRDEADLIVEVVDRAGRRTRLDPVFFQWRKRDDIRWNDWHHDAYVGLLKRLGYRRLAEGSVLSREEIVFLLLRQARRDSDRDFMRRCYHVFLNRQADPAGLEHDLVGLRSGRLSRRDVARRFIRSGEFHRLNLKQ